ncbi:MAG: hypothetical protein J6N45_08500, partial [Alphaproteobacteria bacterium]|nr:hypothetical protein [Alphaproteobacteria bacterium]
MKKFLMIFAVAMLWTNLAKAGNIEYGYNAQGLYVPIKIDGQKVDYGYNSQGDYVPTKIGDNKVDYGYNSQGDYV